MTTSTKILPKRRGTGRPTGRPRKPEHEKLVCMQVTMPPDLRDEIQEYARQHGMTFAAAARTWLWRASTTADFPAGAPASAKPGGYFIDMDRTESEVAKDG